MSLIPQRYAFLLLYLQFTLKDDFRSPFVPNWRSRKRIKSARSPQLPTAAKSKNLLHWIVSSVRSRIAASLSCHSSSMYFSCFVRNESASKMLSLCSTLKPPRHLLCFGTKNLGKSPERRAHRDRRRACNLASCDTSIWSHV